jgi:hypothetical protein
VLRLVGLDVDVCYFIVVWFCCRGPFYIYPGWCGSDFVIFLFFGGFL